MQFIFQKKLFLFLGFSLLFYPTNSHLRKSFLLASKSFLVDSSAPAQEKSLAEKVSLLWNLYKKGESKKFRQALSEEGLDPNTVIKKLKDHTTQYLRKKVEETIFTEIPGGAQKRVFVADGLDFLVGFAYQLLGLGPNQPRPPQPDLPKSFEIAYERGGDLIGRIFYIRDVRLRYQNYLGNQEVLVPYLLVQEKLTEFGAEMEKQEQKRDKEKGRDLLRQFLELNREMWRRGFLNGDVKITINYGVTADGRVVLLDTGGISIPDSLEGEVGEVSYYPSVYFLNMPTIDFEKEFSTENIRRYWGLNQEEMSTRSTFVNRDLAIPLQRILRLSLEEAGRSSLDCSI